MIGTARRRWLVPEVLQASNVDCGPAALKSALQGFGIPVSYRRLREACQTEVDGTSIDTLEELAQSFGLVAEQVLIPKDHLFLPEAHALPAIALTVGVDGATHFVILWSVSAGRVQVMDPADGRHWLTRAELEQRLLLATHDVPAEAFREHAASEEFSGALRRRLNALVSSADAAALIALAVADPSYRRFAALDAGTRAVSSLARSGALPSRTDRARLLGRWLEQAGDAADGLEVPENYWHARASSSAAGADVVSLSGIVLVRLQRGTETNRASRTEVGVEGEEHTRTPRGTPRVAIPGQHSESPFVQIGRLLKREGILGPLLLAIIGTVLGAAGIVEALILSGLLEVEQFLSQSIERFGAAVAALCFLLVATLADIPLTYRALRLGSRLEARLRMAFMQKLPRLPDRYFQSRPVSDMADRAHMVHIVRVLPLFVLSGLRLLCSWAVTALGMMVLDPSSTRRILLSAFVCVLIPLLLQRWLTERDARVRALSASLSRSYLDALRGLGAIRAHGGQRNIHLEHEGQLSAWKSASLAWARTVTLLELAVSSSSAVLSVWLFAGYLRHNAESPAALLYLYWALSFPGFGREFANLARQLPSYTNVLSRLVEPLGALEVETASVAARPRELVVGHDAARLEFDDVTLRIGENTLLSEVNLRVEPGEHVAVIGASGAGKSSLLGLLLGFQRASLGEVRVDGAPLSDARLEAHRQGIAWVDPSVELWNRTLLANLEYGAEEARSDLTAGLESAALHELVGKLARGLQTPLGESGGTLSGGEGQRVRFGRALLRPRPRLALLDEPFRGLDRGQRRALLAAARETFRASTLLCATHDLAETLDFPRVLVISGGRVVEDGAPSELLAREGSHFAALLRAERTLAAQLESSRAWRRIKIDDGRLLDNEGTLSPFSQRGPFAHRAEVGVAE
ncbi:MAG TPA: ATP-binding cassette domain-containing protein [Polyangiaceae bacterium]|nr:ATP-binding cassette domain-containing protein [Polyangiaceae bacterium]